ncbi:glutamine amidotransferase-related protein [Agromyces larvae]|uniref:Gamma-glutamyl-gamma-aminobutyrate hydrolase family protein n=1 Tax=Agromyces larvae TaxID=2929802 RepID=A0ABY4BX19_9MICO|nr:gamma-glutamyl-gamma-aminobutyrate hydrolase family protein [Agromyces larvae]UOE43760.1 gamma-glutamyl-gamma-aminobutyrate hydrolase family protein [Agromyces larvae]
MSAGAGAPVALVLRHDPAIGLGNLEPVLRGRGFDVRVVDTPQTDVSQLDALAPDLVVVLGGEEAAYDTDRHPYLADEIALLRSRIAAEAPVFGVCLGAQLIAATLGARVYRGERKEVGWLEVTPTDAGADSPVRHFAGVPTVQWHGDHYELPEGVELLASSAQYPNQAYRRGDWLLAVQFHPEVDERIHADWLAAWGDELPAYGWTRERMLDAQAAEGPRAAAASAALLNEYLDGIAPPRASSPVE